MFESVSFDGQKVKQNGRIMGLFGRDIGRMGRFSHTILFGVNKKNIAIPIRYPEYAFLAIWRHAYCHVVRIMDIRIDIISEGSETVVRIAGRLSGTAVAELKKACDPIEGPFVIDLSSLLLVDDEGINAIQALVDRGGQVKGVSPFVQLLLDKAPRGKTGGEESKPS
jgi:hypothetical protein